MMAWSIFVWLLLFFKELSNGTSLNLFVSLIVYPSWAKNILENLSGVVKSSNT